jgi:hypothetical protein
MLFSSRAISTGRNMTTRTDPADSFPLEKVSGWVSALHQRLLKREQVGVLQTMRQISAVILLLSVICAPISGIAQSKEGEKRGIRIESRPTQTPPSVTPVAPGDKPELIHRTHQIRERSSLQPRQSLAGLRRQRQRH